MSAVRARAVGAIGLLVLVAAACNFSFTTARVTDVRLARDEEGERQTDVFLPDETIYLVGRLDRAPEDTVLRAEWTAVDVEGERAGASVGEAELEAGDGEFAFDLSNDGLWPEGDYRVELYVEDERKETLDFAVAATGRAPEGSSAGRRSSDEEEDEDDESRSVDGEAIDTLDDVERATIRIEAQGSFIDPEVGLRMNEAGQGSGFVIDSDGLAVTNNHVVTGAAILHVRVGGEDSERRAKVVAVSECSDLAVIDIDGDGFDYLEWYDGRVRPGLDVYAAGFPLGEDEFTLTRGVISQSDADGETGWASVERVLQHDAVINPGSSGGPLVDEDGRVVGINYASDPEHERYYAVAEDEVRPILDRLRDGDDVTSIGVNGTAVESEDGVSGIWVSSVASGSPADEAGIEGGDIITQLEGLQLAADGTMKDYCEILRSHDADDVMRIQVLRYADDEVLRGQLNGSELEPAFSFARELAGDVPEDEADGTDEGTEAGDYMRVEDDSESLLMEVPSTWTEVDGSPWVREDEEVGVAIMASEDTRGFREGYGTPGVFFGASRTLFDRYDPPALLDELEDDLGAGGCTFVGREDYDDPFYEGVYETYTDCGDDEATILAVAAVPKEEIDQEGFILFVLVQAAGEQDLTAVDRILDTFQVQGDLP